MMTDNIDIIVTYLNSNSPSWQESYNYYKNEEINSGIQQVNNRQAFGAERTRNFGDVFKYWFRGVEKNIPWVRYVHLICADETHIPEWLNTDNDKLKIHFHKEFIPEKYLPTFNAITIGNYISNINDLSEYFIHSDDDWYVLNKVEKSDLFTEQFIPKISVTSPPWRRIVPTPTVWEKVINSTMSFYEEFRGANTKLFRYPHLQFIRIKSVEKIWLDYLERNYPIRSRFRTSDDIILQLASMIDSINTGKLIVDDSVLKNSKYYSLNYNTDFKSAKNKQFVCFNDTENLENFDLTNERLNNFFDEILPNKSSFEK